MPSAWASPSSRANVGGGGLDRATGRRADGGSIPDREAQASPAAARRDQTTGHGVPGSSRRTARGTDFSTTPPTSRRLGAGGDPTRSGAGGPECSTRTPARRSGPPGRARPGPVRCRANPARAPGRHLDLVADPMPRSWASHGPYPSPANQRPVPVEVGLRARLRWYSAGGGYGPWLAQLRGMGVRDQVEVAPRAPRPLGGPHLDLVADPHAAELGQPRPVPRPRRCTSAAGTWRPTSTGTRTPGSPGTGTGRGWPSSAAWGSATRSRWRTPMPRSWASQPVPVPGEPGVRGRVRAVAGPAPRHGGPPPRPGRGPPCSGSWASHGPYPSGEARRPGSRRGRSPGPGCAGTAPGGGSSRCSPVAAFSARGTRCAAAAQEPLAAGRAASSRAR